MNSTINSTISKKSTKNGLKFREVSKDHFSSNLNKKDVSFTQLIVRLLRGHSLLASDIQTGKSDPVCFIWIGLDNQPATCDVNKYTFYQSKVMKTTCDPIWNEDITIKIDMSNIDDLLRMKCIIFVRDEDINDDGSISYDDLG